MWPAMLLAFSLTISVKITAKTQVVNNVNGDVSLDGVNDNPHINKHKPSKVQ